MRDRGLLGRALGRGADAPADGRRRRLQPGRRPAPPVGQGGPAQQEGGAAQRDEAVLAETGIRVLRERPVFTTPNVYPPDGFEQAEVGGDAEVREVIEPQHCYVCKQHYVEMHPFYDQLCPACGDFNFRKRARDGRPVRPGRAPHGRPREDRLPGRDQAAARGCAPDRHDALPARLRRPLRPGARLRGVGRPARDLRARPAPHAERRGVLPPPRLEPRPARLHRQQRLPDRAPPAGLLPAHARARDRGGADDARRRARGCSARTRGCVAPRCCPPRVDAARRASRVSNVCRALAGAAPARGPRRPAASSSRRAGSTRTSSRSTSASATRGGCCWRRSRRSSCSRRSS